MGKLHRFNSPQHLSTFGFYILDTDPNSKAFVLSQVPDVLTIGKNAFLINGSQFLVPTTDVLVEVTDVQGNVVFSQPIKNYQEGLARVVSMEIYDDTPLGTGLITILGELTTDFSGSAIPPKYAGKYNVMWQKQVLINPFKPNEASIRLYNQPEIDLLEIENPAQKVNGVTTTLVGSGVVTGAPGVFFSGSYQRTYAITFADNNLVKEFVSGTFMATINGNSYTSSIDHILNSSIMYMVTPYEVNNLPTAFSVSGYTIVYPSAPTYQYSPFNESYIQATLSNITTFSGDLRRVKLYIKSTDTSADYKQISDTILEPTELLVTQSAGQTEFNYGYISDQTVINNFWTGSFSAY